MGTKERRLHRAGLCRGDGASTGRLVGAASGLAIMLWATCLPALATTCWRPDPATHIERSGLVFFAEVLATPPPSGAKPSNVSRVATLKVLHNYKGAEAPLIRVVYLDDWGRGRGWKFAPGAKQLVFARAWEPGRDGINADAAVTLCSMLPYHGREELHPVYWRLLSTGRPGIR